MSDNDAPDSTDRKILDIIQTGFPISPRPYAEIGRQLEITEEEAFNRVRAMRASGLIRRLGANFQSAGVGYVSTLCAAKVPPEKLEGFINRVNAIHGVTHNYERDHQYNIWFTLISPSRDDSERILEELRTQSGIEILNLPATRLYKIRVDFAMSE